MSFLQNRQPSIRSQLLPVVTDQDRFLTSVLDFLYNLMKAEQLTPSQHLEIEIKLGAFFQREQNNRGFQDLLNSFKVITQLNHTLLNDFSQYYTFQPCFFWPPWTEIPFNISQNPLPFQHLKMYLRELCDSRFKNTAERLVFQMYTDQNNEGTLSKMDHQIRLDFSFAAGDRSSVTYEKGQISTETIRKKRKGDQDIMKGYNQFRLTLQIETTTDRDDLNALERRILNGEQIKQIRLKSTYSIVFQFFRVDISRVYHLTNDEVLSYIHEDTNWNGLLLNLIKQLHDIDDPKRKDIIPDIHKMRESLLNSSRKCEIEFEVIDLRFFTDNLDPAFRRLLRNVDSFFQIDKVHREILYHKIQQIHPTHSKFGFQPPLIGNYQNKIYRKIHHLLSNKQ